MALGTKNFYTFSTVLAFKMMGFDYNIQYRSGKDNVAADALSRVAGSEILFMAISIVDSNMVSLIKKSYHLDNNLISIVEELQDLTQFDGFELKNGLLRKKGKIVIGPDDHLRLKLIQWHHSAPESGHSSRDLTLKRVRQLFHWKGLHKHVRRFIRECPTCQASKYDCAASPGFLPP